MIRNSITLGRIAGIAIGIHYTWLFVAALTAWSLSQGYFPSNFPGWETSTYWVAGIVSALALFASVLLHELGHSLVAIRRGVPVQSITLFVFGGVAQMKEEAERPGDEFLIAIAGPLTSFLLAAVFWAGSTIAPADSADAAVVRYLAVVNGLLGGFNLLPGFPLDGGRVLRSIIWGVTGSMRRATQVASYVGQGIGFLLLLAGVMQVLGGAVLNGLWTATIGLFLNGAAAQARQAQELKAQLAGVPVSALMNPRPTTADPLMTLDEFVYDAVLRQGKRCLPVVDDGRLIGLVSMADVKEVPQSAWAATTVSQVMTPAPLKTVSPQTGLDATLQLLVEGEFNQLPVVDQGRLVGMLSRADILRFMQLRDVLQPDAGRGDRTWPREVAA